MDHNVDDDNMRMCVCEFMCISYQSVDVYVFIVGVGTGGYNGDQTVDVFPDTNQSHRHTHTHIYNRIWLGWHSFI